jgi:hypothetical protein
VSDSLTGGVQSSGRAATTITIVAITITIVGGSAIGASQWESPVARQLVRSRRIRPVQRGQTPSARTTPRPFQEATPYTRGYRK